MLEKIYDPLKTEEKWLKKWTDKKIYEPKIELGKKPFVIVIPPPNITGALHMGHALNNTLQDILIRYKKLSGENVYWVVGTDHGGIATQNVMEKALKAQGLTKEKIGREEFLKRMWDWYNECGLTILDQLKKLGCAIDFSKENINFTMDEKRANSVFQAFKELWDKDLIYRGERMINWCPRCYTALSDIEVEYKEEKSFLWHIKYPIENTKEFIIVATTRPETLLGDAAVAVNPKDSRYKKLIGKNLFLPLTSRKIPIIADEEIDMEFGTGAVKITPSHDPLDFKIAEKHNLPLLQIISYEGRMINCPEKYKGKKVKEARKEIIEDLKELNLLEKEENYSHNVGKCYRCENDIEPLVSEQWFVKVNPLTEKAIEKTENNELSFYPESWKTPFLNWIKNLKDWCISRQIWWGHRIPAWYCKNCSKNGLVFDENNNLKRISVKDGAIPIISKEKPIKCEKCNGTDFVQDIDVLDTWFSSALWPFSVFSWPNKTKELEYFYPTSILVTGYEILYLWVARMVMSGLFHLNKLPFSKVYLNGIVRDKHGQKMSKSKGNSIDPLIMMKKYGTDAVRFSLIIQAIGGKDIPFSENSIIGGRNFVNKIYNVSRFIQMNALEDKIYETNFSDLDKIDKWILNRFNEILKEYKEKMENYQMPEALDKVYGFLWDEFCDWYIEFLKPQLLLNDKKDNKLALTIHIFLNSLKLLHPFMPFISEELNENLSKYISNKNIFIYENKIPNIESKYNDEKNKNEIIDLMEMIKAIRVIRAQFSIPPQKEIDVIISTAKENIKEIEYFKTEIKTMAKISNLQILEKANKPPFSVSTITKKVEIYISMENTINLKEEKLRLDKEMSNLLPLVLSWEEKIKDEKFYKNAPIEEVEKLSKRIDETKNKIEKIRKLSEEISK